MTPSADLAPVPDWDRIRRAFDDHDRFLISTHVNPDGDGLGAELGLWSYLRARGKDARIVNPDALPERYEFLGRQGDYEAFDPGQHEETIEAAEVVVVLDISKWERLGDLGARLRERKGITVCIDHHPFENNGMADIYAVDLSAAATGQLVYEMIRDWGHEVDLRMALGFYVSILTDTGSFRFSNSDARAHIVAAELVSKGLDPAETYEDVYGNSSLGRIRLMGEALSGMRVEDDGRILMMVISREQVDRLGAVSADSEGFVDIARTVRGSEGVALLMEREDGDVKVSLRSKGRIDVNRAATTMGGGGHQFASGATLPGPLAQAQERVLTALRDEIARLGER